MWSAKIEGVVREAGKDLYVLTVRKGSQERSVKKCYSDLAELESSLNVTNCRAKIALPEEYRLSGLLSSRIILSEYFDKVFASGEDSSVDIVLSQFFEFDAGRGRSLTSGSQSQSGASSTGFDAGSGRVSTSVSRSPLGMLGSYRDLPSQGGSTSSSWVGLDSLASLNSRRSDAERALSSFKSSSTLFASPGLPPAPSRGRDLGSDTFSASASSSRASSLSRAPSVSAASTTSSLFSTLRDSSGKREQEAGRTSPSRLASSIGGLFATSTFEFTSKLSARDERPDVQSTSPGSKAGGSLYAPLQLDSRHEAGRAVPSMSSIFSQTVAQPPRTDATFKTDLSSLFPSSLVDSRNSDASPTSSKLDRSAFSSSILDLSRDSAENRATNVPAFPEFASDAVATVDSHSFHKVGETQVTDTAQRSERSPVSDSSKQAVQEAERSDIDKESRRTTLSSRLFPAPTSDSSPTSVEKQVPPVPKNVVNAGSNFTRNTREVDRTHVEKESTRSTVKVPALDLSSTVKRRLANATNSEATPESNFIYDVSEAERAEVDEELSKALSCSSATEKVAEGFQVDRTSPVEDGAREELPTFRQAQEHAVQKPEVDEKPVFTVSIATDPPRTVAIAEQNAAMGNSSNAERAELEKTPKTTTRRSSKSPKASPRGHRVSFSNSACKLPEGISTQFVGKDASNASILEEVGRLQATLQKIGPQLKEQQAALKEHFTMRQEGLDTHYMAKRLQGVQKFNIIGIDQQVLHISLDSSQTVCAEPGCLIQSDPDVHRILEMAPSGCFSCLTSICCAAQSSMRTCWTNESQSDKVICFGPKFPAKVVPISLSEWSHEVVVKQHAFIAATDPHLKIEVERAGWKDAGHAKLCKKLAGEGLVFVAAAGAVFLKVLRPGDQIVVDSACVVAWQPTCQLGSRFVRHAGCCGGQRSYENVLAGPGKLILQSMPFERVNALNVSRK